MVKKKTSFNLEKGCEDCHLLGSKIAQNGGSIGHEKQQYSSMLVSWNLKESQSIAVFMKKVCSNL